METPKYALSQLVNDNGVTELGWSELARIAPMAVRKYSKVAHAREDIEMAVVTDGAQFLMTVWHNVQIGASPEPASVGGMMWCRARNAVSNWLYHNCFKPNRVWVTALRAAIIAKEGGLSL